MRVFTAIGLADEVDECEYAANASVDAINQHHDLNIGIAGRLVEYIGARD